MCVCGGTLDTRSHGESHKALVTCKRSGVSVTDFNVMLAVEYLDVCLILGSE